MDLNIQIKTLDKNAVVPTYGSEGAAAADLYAINDYFIEAGASIPVHTGIAMAIPKGYAGHIYARSGLSCKEGLAPANKVGVIDSDYRGEIIVMLHNHDSVERFVKAGQRVAQIEFVEVCQASFNVVDELDDTARGNGGFGSTGKT